MSNLTYNNVRNLRLRDKQMVDKQRVEDFLEQIKESYQPDYTKQLIKNTLAGFAKATNSPEAMILSSGVNMADSLLDNRKYDASNAPEVFFYDTIVDEAKERVKTRNDMIEFQKNKSFLDALVDFGFNTKDGKGIPQDVKFDPIKGTASGGGNMTQYSYLMNLLRNV